MKVSILFGSYQENRLGERVVKFIQKKLEERGHDVNLLDAKEIGLPFLEKMYKEYEPGEAPENMQKTSEILKESDGFVVVAGEYNHLMQPGLKNLIDHFQKEYFFKPSAIVSYSIGSFGGVRVASHMRDVLAELGMSSVPSTLPIPKAKDAFDENGVALDEAYDRRVERFLNEFEWYLRALKNERDKGLPNQ